MDNNYMSRSSSSSDDSNNDMVVSLSRGDADTKEISTNHELEDYQLSTEADGVGKKENISCHVDHSEEIKTINPLWQDTITGYPIGPRTQFNHFDLDNLWIRENLKDYLPLYKATINGDWKTAKEIFRNNDKALTVPIAGFRRTALHIAAGAGHSHFVMKLVKRMPSEALALQDSYHNQTALHIAALAGITNAAKAMVNKNKDLTQIRDKFGCTPVHIAAINASKEQKDMVCYLCNVTRDEEPSFAFSGPLGPKLVIHLTMAGLFDVALFLIQRHPELIMAQEHHTVYNLLKVLVEKSSAFPSGGQLRFWDRIIYQCIPLQVDEERVRRASLSNMHKDFTCRGPLINFFSWTYLIKAPRIKQVYLTKLVHVQAMELLKCICAKISKMDDKEMLNLFLRSDILVTAAEKGIIEIVKECIQIFPDQLWFFTMGRTIFHIAVEHRQEKVFNLLSGMSAYKKILASSIVEGNNNILHLAGKIASPNRLNIVSGAALQMQRELQWYKEVEKIVRPTYKECKNDCREVPRDTFTREHRDLVKKGEIWMKSTAQTCMVAATLIATVVFSAAFTVPGGYISDNNSEKNGNPIFLHNKSFMVFIISDALALFSSTTSVLMFLSILTTSRYTEQDFLMSLPKRLTIGLATLFFSIATMMIAFTATLSIILTPTIAWASIPIVAIACLSITMFAIFQFPLFFEIVISTYGPSIFCADSSYKLE